MSDPSLPPGPLTHLLTAKDRAYQDARLQPHLDRGWSSGLFDRWRADLAVVYGYFKALILQYGRALGRPQEESAVAKRYVREYAQLILTLASAGDRRRLIPVDLWPDVPELLSMTETTEVVLQVFTNVIRDELGLFTPGRLLVNRHYTIMLAHVFVHPVPLRQASDLPDPYPWPFVIRVDQEGTPVLDPQHDMTRKQHKLADRLATALRAWPKQAGRAPRGSIAKRQEQSSPPARTREPSAARMELARKAAELVDRFPRATYSWLRGHEEFLVMQELTGITVVDDSEMHRLVKLVKGEGWRKPRGRSPQSS